MKPARIHAEKERRAKVEFRKLARRIPDNAVLANILYALPDRALREGFLRQVQTHLRFKVGVVL